MTSSNALDSHITYLHQKKKKKKKKEKKKKEKKKSLEFTLNKANPKAGKQINLNVTKLLVQMLK